MSRDRPDPEDWPVRRAVERYLRRRQSDASDETVQSYHYRPKPRAEWCEGVGIERVGDLRRHDPDDYSEIRTADIAPSTLENEMKTPRLWIEYLESLDAVPDGMSESVRIPNLDPQDRVNEQSLRPADALPLLSWLRSSDRYGDRFHTLLEVA